MTALVGGDALDRVPECAFEHLDVCVDLTEVVDRLVQFLRRLARLGRVDPVALALRRLGGELPVGMVSYLTSAPSSFLAFAGITLPSSKRGFR